MSLGTRIRKLRETKGLTQKELAEPYYTHAYISTIESGRRSPDKQALEHIAHRLGVGTEELLTGRPPTLSSELDLGLSEARRQVSKGRVKEARKRYEELAKEAKRFKLAGFEARATGGLALCEERGGRPREAAELYLRAQKLASRESALVRVDAIAGEARCAQATGDIRYAIHLLESALIELERQKLEDPSAMLRLHASLIGAYFEAGLYQHAYRSAELALGLAPSVADAERLGNMHLNAAWALHHQGRARDAQDCLLKAQTYYEQLDLALELGRARLATGMMLARKGAARKARAELETAIEAFRESDSTIDEARTLNELARVWRSSGRLEEAAESLEASLALLEDKDHPGLAGWANRELGLCLAESDPPVAEKHVRAAIELFELSAQPVQLAITHRVLGDLLGSKGKTRQACESYRTGILFLEEDL